MTFRSIPFTFASQNLKLQLTGQPTVDFDFLEIFVLALRAGL